MADCFLSLVAFVQAISQMFGAAMLKLMLLLPGSYKTNAVRQILLREGM
jgi:hypothetical protein